MTQPSNPGPPTLPATREQRLLEAFEALVEPVKKSNELAAAVAARDDARTELDALTAKRLGRQVVAQAIAAGLFVVAFAALLGAAQCQAGRLSDVTTKLEETTRLLESLRSDQDLTSRKVDAVKSDVQAVANEQPIVVLQDAGAGKPAKPTIVVRQPKPKPPPTPSIAVPLGIEDAGAPQ